MHRLMRIPNGLLALCLALFPCRAAETPVSKDTGELAHHIEQVIKENHVPGACVALVDRQGVRWMAGIGKCDVAAGKDASVETLFRVGSISKMFVSLAALKLQGEGRLDLDAPLRALAPEVAFRNPWEATDPVRLAHLLEHSSGWDDLTFREMASSDPRPLTLKEGLDLDPRSRTSRWRPGTRYAYCNSGPAVVAYVIQKITGQDFETYVQETFFKPLDMSTASFRLTPEVDRSLTRLYGPDGTTPISYWHTLMRPVGGLNVSAREIAQVLRLLLNRGRFEGTELLPLSAVARMETPMTGLGARTGLVVGEGLSNRCRQDEKGFAWHGHSGDMPGAHASLAYLPEAGVGYFYAINGDGTTAVPDINRLLRAYLTKDLPRPLLPAAADVPVEIATTYRGWYMPCNPRRQDLSFFDYQGVTHITFDAHGMLLNTLLGDKNRYLAVTPTLFRPEEQPLANSALLPEEDGRLMIQEGGTTWRRISLLQVGATLGLTGLFVLGMLGTAAFALVWVPRKLFRRMKGVKHLSLRIWPLVATLAFVGINLLVISISGNLESFGQPTPLSWGLCLLTLLFAFASAAGCVQAFRVPLQEVKPGVWILSVLTSFAFALVALFLACHGFIGIRTWA